MHALKNKKKRIFNTYLKKMDCIMVKVLQSQDEQFTAGFESKFFGLTFYVELKNFKINKAVNEVK